LGSLDELLGGLVNPLNHPPLKSDLESAVGRLPVTLDRPNRGRQLELPACPEQLAFDGECGVLEPVSKSIPLIHRDPGLNR